jgi:hypothetical protein
MGSRETPLNYPNQNQPETINGLLRKIRSSIDGRDCEEKSEKDS